MFAAKGFCDDLTEGKFSFPVIHSIRNSPIDEILNTLKLRTNNIEVLSRALEYMQTQTNSLEYTKAFLRGLHQRVNVELERIQPTNGIMEKLLEKLKL